MLKCKGPASDPCISPAETLCLYQIRYANQYTVASEKRIFMLWIMSHRKTRINSALNSKTLNKR